MILIRVSIELQYFDGFFPGLKIFFGKLFFLEFKEFHGRQCEPKIIRKKLTPGQSVQKKYQSKKRRHSAWCRRSDSKILHSDWSNFLDHFQTIVYNKTNKN